VPSVLVGLALAQPASEARAASDALPIAITYQAIASCPSEMEFYEEVRARSPRVGRAVAGASTYRARIAISADQAGDGVVLGDLEISDLENHRARRRIEGTSCLDVARALALVVALEIGDVVRAPSSVEPRHDPKPMAPGVPKASWVPSVGLGLGFRSGIAAGVSPTGGLFVAVERNGQDKWFVPTFRMGAFYGSGEADAADVTVALRLAAVALEGCVWRATTLDDRLVIVPCLRWEAGLHVGEIRDKGTGTGGAPWMATGLVARLHFSTSLGVFVEAEVSGAFLHTETRFFEAGTKSPVFTTPSVTSGAALAIGAYFP